jgi:hypothetical protein
MAGTVKLKRSAVQSKVPTTTDLELGELALNTYDGKAYIKKSANSVDSIVEIGRNTPAAETHITIEEDYSIPDDIRAASFGETTIDSGVTIEIGANSEWIIADFSQNSVAPQLLTTQRVITQNVAPNTGENMLSINDVEVATGFEVTVPTGSTWVVAA